MTDIAAERVKLREWTTCGGCAAKWGASALYDMVANLAEDNPELLIGLAPFDDAAVRRITEDIALVATTDFFPPLVDDPADFGWIAAANACSDVWAMGGDVILALNIAAFPENLPPEVITTIFSAASDAVAAAGGVTAGGHTIRNPEPIFGLAVQGLIHPDHVWTKRAARPGQLVALSKALGTGIALASGDPTAEQAAIEGMRVLNREAAEALRPIDAAGGLGAVTDVTGYGLAGHCWEVISRSEVGISIAADALPAYSGVLDAARRGVRTGGDARNRSHLAAAVTDLGDLALSALVFDPQTSGGLLVTVDPQHRRLLEDSGFAVIGETGGNPELRFS